MLSNQNQSFGKQNIQDFNLKKTLSLYSKQWKWFLLSVMIGLGVAFIYLRYTTPVYEASAKIMLLDEDREVKAPIQPVQQQEQEPQDREPYLRSTEATEAVTSQDETDTFDFVGVEDTGDHSTEDDSGLHFQVK